MIETLGLAMALQFKPDGHGGWLYRKDQVGPAYPATQSERDRYVRWHAWMTALSMPLMMMLVIATAMISQAVLGDSDHLSPIMALVSGCVPLGLIYLFIKYISHLPARAFARRTVAGAAVSRKQVFGRHVRNATDRKLLTTFFALVIVMALGALRAPRDPRILWVIIGVPAAVCLGFRWWRYRIEHGD